MVDSLSTFRFIRDRMDLGRMGSSEGPEAAEWVKAPAYGIHLLYSTSGTAQTYGPEAIGKQMEAWCMAISP